MHPEEEITDEDTVDEAPRDTLVEPLLVKTIKEQQNGTALKTENATDPTSTILWIKHRRRDPKKQ